ncbi:unnamed protein product [Bursaphelenchus xylophilus]|uniref:(pine wood nematode) hypothetical protein n=1 Tax=Bursaphelenchus xylophilus TaxID=6326 RepID=A0A1I7RKF1_BURXY|nr:unnamed protein product [Bursaphelenchus xylophilus]CAG9131355.1 unnamed protein product [Bursaphelenchus xylophilus]
MVAPFCPAYSCPSQDFYYESPTLYPQPTFYRPSVCPLPARPRFMLPTPPQSPPQLSSRPPLAISTTSWPTQGFSAQVPTHRRLPIFVEIHKKGLWEKAAAERREQEEQRLEVASTISIASSTMARSEYAVPFPSGSSTISSRSSGPSQSSSRSQSPKDIPKNFKMTLCRHFLNKGVCPKGKKCNFAHGQHELRAREDQPERYRTEPCWNFAIGRCEHGDNCIFLH